MARRCQAFMERSVPEVGDNMGWSRVVSCRVPITAGLFHPFSAKPGVFAGSPLVQLPYGICNLSQGSVTILLKNFYKCIIRQWGEEVP